MVTEGVVRLLQARFQTIDVVGDGSSLVKAAQEVEYDVIVVDISMPSLNGLDAIRLLTRTGVRARYIVLTMHDDAFIAAEALRAGARAYVLKHSAGLELLRAVDVVLTDGVYVSPSLDRQLIDNLIASGDDGPAGRLTPRLRQVLQLIAEGRSMKQVASKLTISRRTAESHKYHVMRVVGARNTAELVIRAIAMGLLQAPPTPLNAEGPDARQSRIA
jgi:DNA-binding NarL/FixJ family response regulator